ncbi:tetratricopeptide repeat protein [Geomonas subterranea]|uniref:Tetratricopeptide repeat protein n=1 Tax=Geomonas subterranea TaxID=2847989 RepID=A0ABX8LLL0_9BACT|nr:CheR family methyltransferase [Geomonas subterranea]QXE91782.1 tetratricopeptide repeat protein [Geomonas subterranea]QXM10125.1 tetratricopeptide repeat protein [Geomonas subterranea]
MPLQILIISDNESFTTYLGELLRDAGHTIRCVAQEKEAFPAIRRQKPDLIILALDAAKIPPLAIEHRVQTPSGPRSVPVIVISECLRLEAELLQVFDFIGKPLDVKRLMDDITAVTLRKDVPPQEQELEPRVAAAFSRHILSRSGLHFDQRNRAALTRGLLKRMAALRLTDFKEYLQYLKEHGEDRHELQKLLQFLTVGETYFYRYPAHFEVLKEHCTARFAGAGPIRIWSAGCSTGEEPYSIAMTLMEALPDWRERDIRIIATDINNRSLKRAREGVYSPWSMRITTPEQSARYFRRVGESFLIRDEVKQLVQFSHLNLSVPCREPVCDELRDLDAIFCRNVLIYFTPETAAGMLERFAGALKPSGLLFLGHSETLLQRGLDLELKRKEKSFYYVRSACVAPAAVIAPLPPEERRGDDPCGLTAEQLRLAAAWLSEQTPWQGETETETEPQPRQPQPAAPCPAEPRDAAPDDAQLLQAARELFDREEFDPAQELLELVLERTPDLPDALVLKGFILAGKGALDQALETSERVLALNDLLPEAYFLKGVLLDAADRLDEAAREYRKALLLDHDFIMPRYHMGRLHLRQGRIADGAREIRNSIKILSRSREEETVPFSGGLTRAVCMLQLQNTLARVA